MSRKDIDLDHAAGESLKQWMAANNHTQGMVAKATGASAASVATWRNGTRPSAKFIKKLEALVGWAWDKPPVLQAKFSASSQEGIFLTEALLRQALVTGQPIDPADPAAREAMEAALDLVNGEIASRETDAAFKSTRELMSVVMGHTDPELMYSLISKRWVIANIDEEAMATVGRVLGRLKAHRKASETRAAAASK